MKNKKIWEKCVYCGNLFGHTCESNDEEIILENYCIDCKQHADKFWPKKTVIVLECCENCEKKFENVPYRKGDDLIMEFERFCVKCKKKRNIIDYDIKVVKEQCEKCRSIYDNVYEVKKGNRTIVSERFCVECRMYGVCKEIIDAGIIAVYEECEHCEIPFPNILDSQLGRDVMEIKRLCLDCRNKNINLTNAEYEKSVWTECVCCKDEIFNKYKVDCNTAGVKLMLKCKKCPENGATCEQNIESTKKIIRNIWEKCEKCGKLFVNAQEIDVKESKIKLKNICEECNEKGEIFVKEIDKKPEQIWEECHCCKRFFLKRQKVQVIENNSLGVTEKIKLDFVCKNCDIDDAVVEKKIQRCYENVKVAITHMIPR